VFTSLVGTPAHAAALAPLRRRAVNLRSSPCIPGHQTGPLAEQNRADTRPALYCASDRIRSVITATGCCPDRVILAAAAAAAVASRCRKRIRYALVASAGVRARRASSCSSSPLPSCCRLCPYLLFCPLRHVLRKLCFNDLLRRAASEIRV
jgi:hypothetical protein